jgi:branched-chain amino acid transport system substrate-binding protein
VRTIALALSITIAASAAIAGDGQIKIGVLSDMSSVYTDFAGQGSVIAAEIAVKEVGGSALGKPIKLISADHQNKPDVGVALARQWYESENVDAIFDVPTSSVALAVSDIAKETKRLAFFSTPIADALTEARCTEYSMAWTWDANSVSAGSVNAQLEKGLKKWFIISQDYAAGYAFEAAAKAAIDKGGGTVVGSVRHPLNTLDWSSFLLQAQSSRAQIILFTTAGTDLVNAMKQVKEFGITKQGQQVATLYAVVNDVHALGLPTLGGLIFVTASYWDLDDASRAFGQKFFERAGKMPSMYQAGVYSSVLQYLKAVERTGSEDAQTIRKDLLSQNKIEDAVVRNGKLLPNGRLIHDMYLAQVKTPEESTKAWDYFKILSAIPGTTAFRSIEESKCTIGK